MKNIAWCFQVTGYKLNIVVIEQKADNFAKIQLQCPELVKRYNIKCINETFEDTINKDLLKDIKVDYTVIAAGGDENSFNIGVDLRRYFWLNNQDDVQIDILIRNKDRSKNIDILKNEKNVNYNLNTFGSIEDKYWAESIVDSDIDKMAKMVHHIQNEDGQNNYDPYYVNYYKSEYYRKSSRATAVHIRYKLFSILKEEYTEDIEADLIKYEEMLEDNNVQKTLAENEHDRWVAYMYADGYRKASIDDVKEYYDKVGENHKNTLSKLHPALVPNEELSVVQSQLEEFIYAHTGEKTNIDLVGADYKLIRRLSDIWNKKI